MLTTCGAHSRPAVRPLGSPYPIAVPCKPLRLVVRFLLILHLCGLHVRYCGPLCVLKTHCASLRPTTRLCDVLCALAARSAPLGAKLAACWSPLRFTVHLRGSLCAFAARSAPLPLATRPCVSLRALAARTANGSCSAWKPLLLSQF